MADDSDGVSLSIGLSLSLSLSLLTAIAAGLAVYGYHRMGKRRAKRQALQVWPGQRRRGNVSRFAVRRKGARPSPALFIGEVTPQWPTANVHLADAPLQRTPSMQL
jgi:hypothetical protein